MTTDAVITFNREWTAAVENIKKINAKTLSYSYQELFTNIIFSTPVDTGRLRGNWQCEINAVPIGETDTLDPAGGSTVSNMANSLNAFKLGDTVYFANNAPYAEAIEFGHSVLQAPFGMVRINIENFEGIVNKWAERNKDG